MATVKRAIDLNTGEILNTVSPQLFRAKVAENENYFPIEIDEQGRFQVMNTGTATAPCVLTIIPKSDVLVITIEGLSDEPLTFRGVKAGQTLVLDGVKREVLINGVDGIEHFDGWEFPKVKPGANMVKINDAYKMFISIAINPRFI